MKHLLILRCLIAVFVSGLVFPALAASSPELDRDVTAALNALYKKYPAAKKLAGQAKAVLVFPSVIKAGLMIGGETGDGVMIVKGKPAAYYNTSGMSY